MAADFTTVGLVKNTKRRGFIPTGSGLDTSDLLNVLSEQLRNYIPAFLKGLREEYLIASLAIPVTSATVAAPQRAVGAALRTVKWTGNDGTKRQLPRIEPERRQDYALTDNCPAAYMFEGNNLILVPAVASGTLVLAYQQRPGQLVLPSDCGAITAIDTGTRTLSFASLPKSFVDSLLYDFIPGNLGNRPSTGNNFAAVALDAAVNSVTRSPFSMVLAATIPSGLRVGDYVCISEETCIPQLPIEIHDLLAQVAAYQVASDTGSTRLVSIQDALTKLEKQLTTILSPRNDGSARVIVNRSGIGRRYW